MGVWIVVGVSHGVRHIRRLNITSTSSSSSRRRRSMDLPQTLDDRLGVHHGRMQRGHGTGHALSYRWQGWRLLLRLMHLQL